MVKVWLETQSIPETNARDLNKDDISLRGTEDKRKKIDPLRTLRLG